jgi:hypothetical protein
MSERSHDKMRPSLPRSRDLPAAIEPAPNPTEGRDQLGRFTSNNPWAPGARWRQLIAEGLGRGVELQSDVARKVSRTAYRYFRSFLRDLPIDCATTRALVAQRARAAALADFYGLRAAELELTSEQAIEAAAQALKWSQHAERLAVTTLDIATRLTKAVRARKPIDAHAEVARRFAPPKPSTEGTP